MENTFGMNIIPENDSRRIEALKRYKILDTPPETAFDNVARLATQIFKVPISLVSLVDAEQVYFKANIGMGKARTTSRGVSLCSLAVMQPGVLVFENAAEEPCLLANPNVAGDFGLKFYAGAPLTTLDGFLIGTLCIIDKTPRQFSDAEREILESLAKIVMDEIELRLSGIQEIEKQQEYVEEAAAINEELLTSNEELVRLQTDLQHTNVQVTAAEERLRLAVEAARLGSWFIDPETKALEYNEHLKQIFGYEGTDKMTFEQAIGQVSPEFREILDHAINQAISSGENYDVSYSQRRFNDDQLVWLRSIGRVSCDIDGHFTVFSGVVMDITEQKEDDQRKNDFISMVSHELKTPLTSMNGYIQMLTLKARKNNDAFTANVLDKANRQTKKMIAMINGFLNMKRLESGKIPIDRQRFDMADLISESEEEAAATISSHRIVFAPVEVIYVVGDKDKIGQVINNFISNAVKYSPKGSTINVACIAIDGNARLSVKDEGMGVVKSDQEKLFDRFYRVESMEMELINGFGIGLYLCREIIRGHKGEIWIESEPGEGSTFFFNLPL